MIIRLYKYYHTRNIDSILRYHHKGSVDRVLLYKILPHEKYDSMWFLDDEMSHPKGTGRLFISIGTTDIE